MIKKIFYLMIAVTMSSAAFAQKATDNFAGKYKTDDGGIVTITKTATGFVGINETKAFVLKDVKFDGKEWKATIINPKQNITASGEILIEGNKLKIVARKGPISKTIYWEIIK
jgi:uncharacterized protein (DUF2147 family)